jgi:hypothetical protein
VIGGPFFDSADRCRRGFAMVDGNSTISAVLGDEQP